MRHLTILLLFSTLILARETRFFRVAAESDRQILLLAAQGFELADARIYSASVGRPAVRWMPENRCVTVLADDPAAGDRLRLLGFRILEQGARRPSFTPQPPTEDLPMQFGWPRLMNGWPTIYGQPVTIEDLNENGAPEIFLSNSEGWLYGWRPNGVFVLGFPKSPYLRGVYDPQTGDTVYVSWVSTGSREGGATGDVNGDGAKELVFAKDIGYLFAYQYNSILLGGFPYDLGLAHFSSQPVLFDFDNDGKDEILLAEFLWDSILPYGPATIHIFNEDHSELPGWPQQIPVFSESSPAVGDIDGDNEVEIVLGSGRDPNTGEPGRIYAFNLDGSICAGFPIEVGNAVNCTPTIYDIDLNGVADVLIRIMPLSSGINGIYAFDGFGAILPGFPAALSSGSPNGAPAAADVNGDGFPEIAYGSVQAVDSAKVWLFRHTGELMPGFPQPVYATWVEESVSLEDVSGDGLADIVCGTNGVSNDPARLWAFDYQGQVVAGFPITINETFSTLETTPTIVDIDGDGDTEIFTASHEGTVYAFDSPGQPATSAWPTYKYNPARLGGIPGGGPTATGGQTGVLPGSIELHPNYPNPFNPQTRISFTLGRRQAVTLAVFDVLGRPVRELIRNEIYEPGAHSLDFRAGNLASGIYYYRLEAGGRKLARKMLLVR
ncbi:MAG: T9SS type A sorting domain-containing protein [Calditrichaceae bacterium]|nr:T9SS type A sorting domain-containing protein [Calditrichia bacterium]NUQ42066.1 T9SS type A sorting domain-containing protein [Calditrichaceae bacterium]